MNADATVTELIGFIASEMARDPDHVVSGNARLLRESVTQASLHRHESGPVLVIWMREWWSYTCVTGKRTMAAIAETAGEYTEHMLGITAPVRVVIGRVNCYRRGPK